MFFCCNSLYYKVIFIISIWLKIYLKNNIIRKKLCFANIKMIILNFLKLLSLKNIIKIFCLNFIKTFE